MEVIPLRKPRKYQLVYDEGTPDQQYVNKYTDTVVGVVFKWLWKKTKNLPGQAKYVRRPAPIKTGPNTYRAATYILHFYDRKWGYLIDPWGPKFTLITPKHAHRLFIDWYGGQNGRTLIKEKNKR